MKSMFLGTCRVQLPAAALRERGLVAWAMRHRFNSPHQILQFIDHVNGKRVVYNKHNVHMISQYAHDEIKSDPNAPILDEINGNLKKLMDSADRFFVELSTVREYLVDLGEGGSVYCDKLSAPKNGKVVVLNSRQVLQVMTEIRQELNRPVTWISHIVPPVAAGLDTLILVRRNLANVVAVNAKNFGDPFIQPGEYAEALGSHSFFRDAGDFDHMSDEAVQAMANVYQSMIETPKVT
jgi:hypothetical protein